MPISSKRQSTKALNQATHRLLGIVWHATRDAIHARALRHLEAAAGTWDECMDRAEHEVLAAYLTAVNKTVASNDDAAEF